MTRSLEPDEPTDRPAEPHEAPDDRQLRPPVPDDQQHRPLFPDDQQQQHRPPAPDDWRPRPFVLARALEPGDEDEAVYPDDVMTWGLAFPDHAMTYFRDPVTHNLDHGCFESVDRARRRYSHGEPNPVRLVWLSQDVEIKP